MILASEVVPAASELFASRKDQVPASQHELLHKVGTMRVLRDLVGIKLIYQDAQRTIPAENFEKIRKSLAQQFEKTELPRRMKQAEVGSRAELDAKLRELGTSLEREKRAFVQRVLAGQWMRQGNPPDDHVSHEEMVNYYHEHIADYQSPARALWEKLTVRIPRYSDGREAYAKLAQMGNQVKRGASMEDVIKAQPRGRLECRGGVQGWLTQGSLGISRTTEQAIFGLPVGRPSKIFRDGDAFHIVRVLQREEFRQTSFKEADQAKIREKLRELRWQEQIQTYLARLRNEIPVWTVFDDDAELAQLQRQAASRKR